MSSRRESASAVQAPAARRGAPPPPTASELISSPGFLRRNERVLIPVATLVALLITWELYGRFADISPLFFSYPTRIAGALVVWSQTTLWTDLGTSAMEFLLGLLLALFAIPIGLVVGSSRRARMAVDPIANALNSTPMLALTPLLVIWLGLGMPSKVAVVFIMAFLPLLINTSEGVATVDRTLILATRSFGASWFAIYRDVVLPGTVPFLVSGMRLALGHAVVGVVIGEFIASTAGVGYRINAAAQIFNTPLYLGGIVLIVAISVVLNYGVQYVEGRLAPWRTDTAE
ncbi:MAG TPA: ABC transporter permease [Candidatus Saccharimonadales bacterium]|nr:ABC transporter permease [Candidatus Saccharimonadales bacterium]